MQRGLVGDWSGEQGVAVVFSRHGQPFEPGGPAVLKVSLDANLVQRGFVIPLCRCACFTHAVPRAFPLFVPLPVGASVPLDNSTVGANVGRCPPQMWGLMW